VALVAKIVVFQIPYGSTKSTSEVSRGAAEALPSPRPWQNPCRPLNHLHGCSVLIGGANSGVDIGHIFSAAVVAGLQVRTVAASPQSLVQEATAGVDRSLKGDRLALPTMSMSAKPTDRQGSQAKRGRLPDGCEAAVSAMTRSSLAQTPGRCIS
jgi:hypothetical protein